jgi:hypothetical protein
MQINNFVQNVNLNSNNFANGTTNPNYYYYYYINKANQQQKQQVHNQQQEEFNKYQHQQQQQPVQIQQASNNLGIYISYVLLNFVNI